MSFLQKILPPFSCPLKIIDLGAMELKGEDEYYRTLSPYYPLDIVGFEPCQNECNKLTQKKWLPHIRRTDLPYAIGDGTCKIFHTTNASMTSSFYFPNYALLDKFQYLSELMQVVKTEEIQTHRLDDLVQVRGADYLKLDIQGAEKQVLENAKELLEEVLVVHTEVAFVSIYQDQPLFGDVDQVLRKNGFQFHRFCQIAGRTFKPLVANDNICHPLSQFLWGDVIYVKDFTKLQELSPEKLLKMAVILHEVYRSFDLCNHILEEYDRMMQKQVAEKYRNEILKLDISAEKA